jgi:Glu-tRNA(Gln) amidotransferase subunit E-like FAD-binding protein
VAVFLTETLKSLKRDGIIVENVSENQIMSLFIGLSKGDLTKEVLSDVFTWFSNNKDGKLSEALDSLSYMMYSSDEINSIIDKILSENRQKIQKNGMKSFGILMGLIMKKVRGKANPSNIKDILKKKIKEYYN